MHPQRQPDVESPRAVAALTFELPAAVEEAVLVKGRAAWTQPLDIAAEPGPRDVPKRFHANYLHWSG